MLDVGRAPSGLDRRARRLASAFTAAGFDARAIPDVLRWKHFKLLMNLGNAVEALCGPSARGGPVAQGLEAEGRQVLAAAGIDVATAEEDAARRAPALASVRDDGRMGGGSTWQSLVRGASIESDWLNGEIVRIGARVRRPDPGQRAGAGHGSSPPRRRASWRKPTFSPTCNWQLRQQLAAEPAETCCRSCQLRLSSARRPGPAGRSSAAMASASRTTVDAAATFSSRYSMRSEPGIGHDVVALGEQPRQGDLAPASPRAATATARTPSTTASVGGPGRSGEAGVHGARRRRVGEGDGVSRWRR